MKNTTEHQITLIENKALGTCTTCSCGFRGRYVYKYEAKKIAKKHLADPSAPYETLEPKVPHNA